MDFFSNVTGLQPWTSMAVSLLIGLLIGAERETATNRSGLGLRDFLLVSAAGWLVALTGSVPLALAMLVVVGAIATVIHLREPSTAGVTTEIAFVVVFMLSYVSALPQVLAMRPQIVALAVVLTMILDAKAKVKAFFRERFTEAEFAGTIGFLALIFVIYPLLPTGSYGPYGFFRPTGLWKAVIMVSGISFAGYFLEKYLGRSRGQNITAILGGLVSTTVATSAFAQESRRSPDRSIALWRSATVSNAIQFLRIVAIVWALGAPLVADLLPAFVGAAIVGLAIGLIGKQPEGSTQAMDLRNPLRLRPALEFAAFLALVAGVNAVATAWYGSGAIVWTAIVGGLVDVDAITISATDRMISDALPATTATLAILVAVSANIVVKSVLSFTQGSRPFAIRITLSMLCMAVVAGAVLAGMAYLSS